MKINCPHGWKSVARIGNITIEDSTVNLCDWVCDSADLCGITTCEYYDTSSEATRRFLKALNHQHTLDGLFERRAKPH